MNTTIYYVGVILNEKILFAPYGFTSYADCYVEAENINEASEAAKEHFERRHKVKVIETRPRFASLLYHDPEEILKPIKKAVQQTIFEHESIGKNEEIFPSIVQLRNERKKIATFFRKSALYFNKILNFRF